MKNAIGLLAILYLCSCGQKENSPSPHVKQETLPPATEPNQIEQQAAVATFTPEGFTATLPKGWTALPGTGMRKVSYQIAGTSIDFYLIVLSMGDLTSNVNRWGAQIGLDAASTEKAKTLVETFDVDGCKTQFVKLFNDAENRGIIAAIIDRSGKYWFFTAKGSVTELKQQTDTLRAFLLSLTF